MTVESSGVDFLLDKMMQLLNSDDQLILEAYEKKLINKDQIESFFEEMQFLGKFLKDSSEHEQVVVNIRDVTNEVDDIIDSLVLYAVLHRETGPFHLFTSPLLSLPTTMTDLAEKIYDGFNSITEDMDFINNFRTEAINLLSWFESQLAEKIGDCSCHIIRDIKLTKIDLVLMIFENENESYEEEEEEEDEIYENEETDRTSEMRKRLIITWLQSGIMPDEFLFLFKLSEIMIYRTEKIRQFFGLPLPDIIKRIKFRFLFKISKTMIHRTRKIRQFFGSLLRVITPINKDVTHISEFRISQDIDLLLSLSEEIVGLVKGISCLLLAPTMVVKRIKEKVMTIYEKASSVTSLDSHMADEFLRRFNFLEQMFVPCDPRTTIRVINSMKMDMMSIYKRYLSQPWPDGWACKIRGRFGSVAEDIKSIKTEVMEIYEKKLYGITGVPRSSHGTLPKPIKPMVKEEIVIGLDEETRMIKELLTEQHEKQLKIISIVGMPGLGKTTLAKKVYNDSFIEYQFYVRAWIYVSQAYRKRDLLLAIFSSAFLSRENICNLSDEKLGEELYKRLKGNRYLMIMDDIWNREPWDDLKRYFPNDSNGSRILFTTRHGNVAVALHSKLHHLRFLNEDESWDLLQLKTFHKESCPQELMEIGKQIVRKCQGLPLAIVVISGLLAKQDKTLEWWKHVDESVSSYMVSDPEQYMHTLELSYTVLPHYLKACFLYLGAFTEDYEIPVQKLIWLWVAEGFIWQNEQRTLEEVAEDYLMDLIDRSLVIVSKKRSNGEIKACCVHDLLRDLCLRKAQKENFLHQVSKKGHKENLLEQISNKVQEGIFFEQIFGKPREENLLEQISNKVQEGIFFDQIFGKPREENLLEQISGKVQEENLFQQIFGSSSSSAILNKHHRLCIPPNLAHFSFLEHCPFASKVRSILSFGCSNSWGDLYLDKVSFIHTNFILLRVLDLSSIQIPSFPKRITRLVLLRYLALHVEKQKFSLPSISNLLNLQSLILGGSKGSVLLSDDIWKTVKLRHLYTKRLIEFSSIPSDGHAFLLDNLQTVGKLHLYSGGERALKWIPNLRKLKCYIRRTLNGDDCFPKLDFLIHLETLNVISSDCKRFFHQNNFPPSLRNLTLSYVSLRWVEMLTLGMLPNLEVLKLLNHAFEGPRWDTGDGGFRKLRFLKFQDLDICQWNASSNQFPHLQQLVLEGCARLEELPCSLGEISTLEVIQLRCCSHFAENSARQIQEEQRSMGNDGLKIQILARGWNL